MIPVTVELSDALHGRLARMADARGTTAAGLLAEFAAEASAQDAFFEKMAARAAEPGPTLAEILDRVPNAEPLPWDRLENPEPFDRAAYRRLIGRPDADG